MADLPTPIDGPHPERDVHLRHGSDQSFDAVGLFTQWLAEQVARVTKGNRIFFIELRSVPPHATVQLKVLAGFRRHWTVDELNVLLESDPRGGLLKEEIRVTLAKLREYLAGS